MKGLKPFFGACLLPALCAPVFAAKESTKINISVTSSQYVKLVGSVVGAERYFTGDDIAPVGNGNNAIAPTVSLGSLGLESSIPGNCTLNISAKNNFSLLHTVSGKKLANFQLMYNLAIFNSLISPTVTIPCNSPQQSLDMVVVGNFKKNLKAGVYQDVVRITVTTP